MVSRGVGDGLGLVCSEQLQFGKMEKLGRWC